MKFWPLIPLFLPGLTIAQATLNPAPPPLSVGGKFHYQFTQSFGLRGVTVPLIAAGYTQLLDTPKEWGGGMGGFSERYANAFGTSLSRHAIEFTLESALREDPRYFPSTESETRKRIGHAIRWTFITKTDAGSERFAYSRVISAFASGQVANAWQPPSNNDFEDGLLRTVYTLAASAGYNVVQEFIPRLRPRELRQWRPREHGQ